MSITRRDFVKTAGASGAALGLTSAAAAASPAPAAGPVQNEDIWIDALGGLRLGEKGHDEIRRAGLTSIETTLGSAGNPTFGYERAVQDVARWHRNFAENPDHIIHVRTVKDIHEAKRTGKLAVMIERPIPSVSRSPIAVCAVSVWPARTIGCLGKVGTIAVPNSISGTSCAMTARTVRASKPPVGCSAIQ